MKPQYLIKHKKIVIGWIFIKRYYRALMTDHLDDLWQVVYLTFCRNKLQGYDRYTQQLNKNLTQCANELGWRKLMINKENGKRTTTWVKVEINTRSLGEYSILRERGVCSKNRSQKLNR